MVNASNDQARYGLGKLIYFQKSKYPPKTRNIFFLPPEKISQLFLPPHFSTNPAPTYQPDVNYSGFSQDSNRPGSGNNDPNNPDRRGPNSGNNSGNSSNDSNMSLDSAAFYGQFNQLQNILAQGTPINTTDLYGTYPPLHN
jgi:hypothetical protein